MCLLLPRFLSWTLFSALLQKHEEAEKAYKEKMSRFHARLEEILLQKSDALRRSKVSTFDRFLSSSQVAFQSLAEYGKLCSRNLWHWSSLYMVCHDSHFAGGVWKRFLSAWGKWLSHSRWSV